MDFDFLHFSKNAATAYNRATNPYSLQDCLDVFQLYFQIYEKYLGHPHPPIKHKQISRIMGNMPFLCQIDSALLKWLVETRNYVPPIDIDKALYPDLIELHFRTKYRNCDYNINHFFSGRIRELRLHEMVAGYG